MEKYKDISAIHKISQVRINNVINNLETLEYNSSFIFTEKIKESLNNILPELYKLKELINDDVDYFHEVIAKEAEYKHDTDLFTKISNQYNHATSKYQT